ncbi:hypothetical protein ES707_15114 [subsurface metagenome]
MSHVNEDLRETLRAEYAAAQADYLHNDNFPWQIGSILIAGSFIFWGLLIDKSVSSQIFGITTLPVTLLLSIWILYAHHYRQTYRCKLHRMWEIEDQLGMKSHVRWRDGIYKTFGPRGHNMGILIYGVTCLVAPTIGFFKIGFSLWLMLPIPVIVVTLILIGINEKKISALLAKLSTTKSG